MWGTQVSVSDEPRLLADRYRLDSVLGRGGMGRVWRGWDEMLGREVAVKEVRPPDDLDEQQRDTMFQRMLREARMTARLRHSAVVTIYDVVSEEGRPFIVMELVLAPSLAEEISRRGSLPPQRVAAIGLLLLDALDTAHRSGIVHRDVKPSNVLLDGDRVVLTDFGIATSESDPRMTSTGLLVGSPAYMSPERMRGQPIGPAADMWSLGATLYAAVEGRPPFDAGTTMGAVSAVLTEDLPAPTVDGPMHEALVGLLDKDHVNRLTADEVAPLLRSALVEPGTAAPAAADAATPYPAATPAPVAEPEARPPRRTHGRHLLLAALGGLVVLALALLALVALVGQQDETPAAGSPEQTTPEQTTPEQTPTERTTTEQTPTEQTPTDPAGFRLHDDPLGFRMSIPEGWQRTSAGSGRVDFVSPDNSMLLRVDQVDDASGDPEQVWLDAERELSARVTGYERIRIEPVRYRSWDAADWEFTFEGDNGTVHVLDRGIVTDTRGFALYVAGPDADWDSTGRRVFEAAAESFQPVR